MVEDLSEKADCYILIFTHHWELVKSVDSGGSLSLLLAMKVMV